MLRMDWWLFRPFWMSNSWVDIVNGRPIICAQECSLPPHSTADQRVDRGTKAISAAAFSQWCLARPQVLGFEVQTREEDSRCSFGRRQARFEMTGTTLKAVKWKWKLREMYPDSRRTHRNQPKETALLCWTMQPQFLQATSRCLEGLKFLTHQNVSKYKVPTWEKHLRTAQYSFMDAEVRKMLRKDTPQGVRRRSSFVEGGGVVINSLEEWHGNDWIAWINILGFKKCSDAEFSRIFFCPSRGFRTVSLWKSASSHLYRNLVAVYFDNFGVSDLTKCCRSNKC